MGRALAPLGELIGQITSDQQKIGAYESAALTARPEVASRLGQSWRLYGASPETHLANAESDVEVDDPLWALQQALREVVELEDWGTSIPVSERQNSILDRIFGQIQELAPDLGVDLGNLPSNEEVQGRLAPGGIVEQRGAGRDQELLQSEADRLLSGGTGFDLPGPIGDVMERVTEYSGRAAGAVNSARHAAAGTAIADNVLEPTIQGAVMVLDYPYQFTQANFRTSLRRYRKGGLIGDRGLIPTSVGGVRDLAADQVNIGLQTELPRFVAQTAVAPFREGLERPDIGDGYFLGGSFREGVDATRRSEAEVDGHTATIGRWVASPLEPGTREHTLLSGFVDAAIAVAGPGELALARSFEAGAAARTLRSADGVAAPVADNLAQRLFKDWGGLRRTRPSYDADRVRHALDTDMGQRAIVEIARSDAFDVRRLFGNKVPAETAQALAQTDDVADVRRILQSELGSTILTRPPGHMRRGVGSLLEVGRESSAGRTVARALDTVPARWMDIDNPTRALEQVDVNLTNIRASEATRRRWTNRFADTASRFEREELLKEFETEVGLRLAIGTQGGDAALTSKIDDWVAQAGDADLSSDELFERILRRDNAPTGVAEIDHQIVGLRDRYSQFITQWTDDIQQGRAYTQGAIARGEVDAGVMVGGEHLLGANEPFLHAELVGKTVPMPDPRPLRRMFSSHPGLFYRNQDLRWPSKIYDALARFESSVFKPAVLIRLAWTVRVVGEEQLRMAASHHSNAITHPIHHIALATGRGGKRGIAQGDALGATFASLDDHVNAMARGSQGYGAGRQATIENWDIIDTRQLVASDQTRRAVDAWSERVAMLGHDPVVQYVLRHEGTLDELSEAFWVQMRATREDIMSAHPRGGPRRTNGAQLDLTTRAGSDAYLDEVSKIIDEISGGDVDIREALRSHSLDGSAISADPATAAISSGFKKALERRADSMPAFLPEARQVVDGRGGVGIAEAWDAGTEWMMTQLMSKPTNRLSRSPVFRERYWDEIASLAPRISRGELDEIIKNAGKANISGDLQRTLRQRLGRNASDVGPNDVGSLSLKEADMIAKGHALDHVQDLLFDLTKRNQFFDAQRLIFPFGDAWAEVVTRWGKLVKDNPNVIRRGEQVIQSGRDQGWFYEDPETGDEVFTFPGSDWINRGLAGVDVPFKGRLKGLSLATEILPGIGPTAQIGLSGFFPDGADADWAREILFPYGQPDTDQHPLAVFYDSFMPTGPGRIIASRHPFTAQEQRELVTATSRSFDYLISTGDYDIQNPDPEVAAGEFQRAFEDGRRSGQMMVLLRGIGNLVLPTAPAPDWNIENLSGEQVSTAMVRELSGALYDVDRETAANTLIKLLGVPALFSSNGRSVDLLPGRGWAPTKEAEEWARENSDLVDAYPIVAQIFAPQEGEFDPAAFTRLRRTGSREDLTYEGVVSDGLHSYGLLLYYDERDRIVQMAGGESKLNAEARRYLNDYDDWLKNTLTFSGGGYAGRLNDPIGVPLEVSADAARPQLVQAVNDERLKDTEIAVAVRTYLDVEDQITAQFRAAGNEAAGWESSVAGRPGRQFLVEMANFLTEQNPDFAGVYESILRDRMEEGLAKDDKALEEVPA